MTRFFCACNEAAVGAGALTEAARATGTSAGVGAGAGAGAVTGAGAGAAAAAGAGALAGSSITPMRFSDTPAFFSFTKSAGVRLAGLFSLCRVLMIKLSESPAFTDWITESTADGAAAGFGAAAAGFGAATAGLGAAAGGGACPTAIDARPIAARNTRLILSPSKSNGDHLHVRVSGTEVRRSGARMPRTRFR